MAPHVDGPTVCENVAPVAQAAMPIRLDQEGRPAVITQAPMVRNTNGNSVSLYGRSQTVARFTAKISIEKGTATTHAPDRFPRANIATAKANMVTAWSRATTEWDRVSHRVRWV